MAGSLENMRILILLKKERPFEVYGEELEDVCRHVPNISKAKRLIGFKPKVSLEMILQIMIDLYRSSPNR